MIVQLPRRLLPLAAACALIAATTGCAAEARSSSGQGGADIPTLCLDLDDMSQAVTKARNLSAFSTPGDVKTARAAIDNAFAAVEESADAEQVDVTALKKEVDKFDAFATRVPPGMTIGQSGSTIGAQAAVVAKEQAKVSEAAGCTPGS
jgi:hypothetical protein